MLQAVLQVRGNRKLESVIPGADSRIGFLSRHHNQEVSVNVDRDDDRAFAVVRVPSISRNEIAIGDIEVSLVIRRAAGATGGSRGIERQVLIRPSKLRCYRVGLSIFKAGRRMEYPAVVRAAKYVSQILAVERSSNGADQC